VTDGERPTDAVTSADLDQLYKRYSLMGAVVISADYASMNVWRYDQGGNELRVTIQAHGWITCRETPVEQRQKRRGRKTDGISRL
jgi:hypothetical protein